MPFVSTRLSHFLSRLCTYLYNCNSCFGPSNREGGRNGKLSLKPVQKTTASMFSSTVPSSNMTPVEVKAFRSGLTTTLPCRIWPRRSSLTKGFLSKNLTATGNTSQSRSQLTFWQILLYKIFNGNIYIVPKVWLWICFTRVDLRSPLIYCFVLIIFFLHLKTSPRDFPGELLN